MIQGIYQSAAALDGLEAWNDVVARNITSAGTAGFRRGVVLFDGVLSGVMSYGNNAERPMEQPVLSPVARNGVNFATGDLLPSSSPHDFGIAGPGFFRAARVDGTEVYTRDGQFRVGPQGELQTRQGANVMGADGPIQMLIDGGPITVDPEGRVRQGDQEIGTITIYDFDNPHALMRTDGGFVIDPENPQVARPSEIARVQQGFTEMSNVSPMYEMAQLVSINNAMQANQRVLQTFDGLSDRAVQVLGSSS